MLSSSNCEYVQSERTENAFLCSFFVGKMKNLTQQKVKYTIGRAGLAPAVECNSDFCVGNDLCVVPKILHCIKWIHKL